jgi:hypothetical protein
MDERWANIDLLFRNGLKDYEVLPPPDAWNNIKPVARKNHFLILIKYAAAFIAIASLGFITWSLTRTFNDTGVGTYAVFDIFQSQPIRVAQVYSEAEPSEASLRSASKVLINAPEKAIYNPPVSVLNEDSQRTFFFSGPQKASVRAPQPGFNPGNFALPEYQYEKPLTEKRWTLSAMMSPTYYSKTGKGGDELSGLISSENPLASYAGGLGIAYRISKRFTIQTGFYYSSYGQEIGGVNLYSGFNRFNNAKGKSNFEVLTSNGTMRSNNGDLFIMGDPEGKVLSAYNMDVFDPEKARLNYIDNSITQSISYIQMPVYLRYKLLDRNIDFNLLGGVSYDFLIGNSAYTKTENGKYLVGSTQGLNSLMLSSSFGMGLEYNFSDKVSLNIEPTVRYFINSFNDAVKDGIHPYSFGVFSGFSYRF